MTQQNLSRRTLAKGAAWSVPLAAASASVPALAASQPRDPKQLTKEEVQSGNCARIAEAMTFDGLRNYGHTFGGYADANMNIAVTIQAQGWPYAQPMSIKTYNGQGWNRHVPAPSITLPRAGGKTFKGRASLASRGRWGIRQGVPVSPNLQWKDSAHADSLDWHDATLTLPLEFSWSDDGGEHACVLDFKCELLDGWQAGLGLVRGRMWNPRITVHGK